MSATIITISEPVMVSPQDSSPPQPPPPIPSSASQDSNVNSTSNTNPNNPPVTSIIIQIDVESARCDCCGLTEDCTPEYISRIRERYAGRWICGLCSEAVKEEIVRSAEREERLISPEEAMARCRKIRMAAPDTDPTADLIAAVRQILRRSLDGRAGGVRSTPASPIRRKEEVEAIKLPALVRSESCFPDISS